jgi:hypothetical protein
MGIPVQGIVTFICYKCWRIACGFKTRKRVCKVEKNTCDFCHSEAHFSNTCTQRGEHYNVDNGFPPHILQRLYLWREYHLRESNPSDVIVQNPTSEMCREFEYFTCIRCCTNGHFSSQCQMREGDVNAFWAEYSDADKNKKFIICFTCFRPSCPGNEYCWRVLRYRDTWRETCDFCWYIDDDTSNHATIDCPRPHMYYREFFSRELMDRLRVRWYKIINCD